VVLYAAGLRFEALMARYGWAGPGWAVAAERMLSDLHPDALRWQASLPADGGDPYHYQRRAQEMAGFYEPSVREPLFPFATRLLLAPMGQRPWTVNAASAVFSTLLVLATYLLGAAAFSRLVGLGAAALMAVDRDALWWGVEGFRDDAFALFVVLSAALLWRVSQRPRARTALAAGVAGGAACLTRVTALSFLLPAHAWLAWGRDRAARARRRAAAVSLSLSLALVGPFLLSCALAYGDAFHAVNAHTRFYRSRAGVPHETDMSWHVYLRTGFSPVQLARTGLQGVTTVPFSGKWQGLDYLSPWLRRTLAPLAVAGLLLWLARPAGRLMLLVLLGALAPYAFTWNVPGGAEWRFTLLAYPFYLLAALWAVDRGITWLRRTTHATTGTQGLSVPASSGGAGGARTSRSRRGGRS
jgi:4-amino-4-deoxy-L-arabinose transferase-like glycosyltransferase